VPFSTAAVAVVIGQGERGDEELLLIRRSESIADPWSGHVALPGGRVEPGDGSFRETAARETREEVGIDLTKGRFLGYMGEFHARTREVKVVPSVFKLEGSPGVILNREVASYKWVPLHALTNPGNRSSHFVTWRGVEHEFPAYEVGDYHIWGVTERILSTLVEGLRDETD